MGKGWIVDTQDKLLITGANGFIGAKVVEVLLAFGFRRLTCVIRSTGELSRLNHVITEHERDVQLLAGNLLSKALCRDAAAEAKLVFHLAAGMEKSFASSFMNSAITTRNLLDSVLHTKDFRRFINVSSFAVYSAADRRRGAVFDETCEVEKHHMERYDPYCFGKVMQDEIVQKYGRLHHVPYVIVRPGAVYGPGVRQKLTGRVGIDTFGVFLHLGGTGEIPLTYVDNCAEAIVLAGLVPGIDREVFNIVDDELPTSRRFLAMYKRGVRSFRSIPVPYAGFFLFCYAWECYSKWSRGQLPPAFNRRRCAASWKPARYSNAKLKRLTGWQPKVRFEEGTSKYFSFLKATGAGIR